jgi:hypothetical protein
MEWNRTRYGEFVRPFIVEAGPAKVDSSCLPLGFEGKYKPVAAKTSLQKKLKDSVGSFSAHNGRMLDFIKQTLTLPPSITERPASPRQVQDVNDSIVSGAAGAAEGASRPASVRKPPPSTQKVSTLRLRRLP